MKCQPIFSEKKKIKVLSAEIFTQHVKHKMKIVNTYGQKTEMAPSLIYVIEFNFNRKQFTSQRQTICWHYPPDN